MKTYFIRHSSTLDIDENTIKKMWDKNFIGIHYPKNKRDQLGKRDSKSTNPDDYIGTAKSKLKILNNLALNGGYVYSVFKWHPEVKIGFVPPNSKIRLFKGKWGNINNHNNREAILKVLKIEKVKTLSKEESISLNSVQPRQGTICVWNKVGNRVQNLVENNSKTKILDDLTPDQQEVMCMEFLRLPIAREEGLPQILITLTPIGRTMKEVDIYALSTKKEHIICQVTFYELNKSKRKINILSDFTKNKKNKPILFCNTNENKTLNGITVYPISRVFSLFCKKSKAGKLWLKNIK